MKRRGLEVLIVGGGPAGAAAALALAKCDPTLTVAVLEASTFDRPRVGETLHPTARPLLEQLGVWKAFQRTASRKTAGTASAWGSDELGGEDFMMSALGQGFHLERTAFDAMLLDEASRRGATVYLASKMHEVSREGDLFQVRVSSPYGSRTLACRFLIDATGRSAHVATALGARRFFFDRQVATFLHYDAAPGSFDDTRTLVEATEHGFWYSARLPEDKAVVAFLTDGDLAATLGMRQTDLFQRALAGTFHTAKRFASATPVGEPGTYSASSSALDLPAGDGWVAAGDAALAYDPLSGQGIVRALHQGFLAAYAASDYLGDDEGRGEVVAKFQTQMLGELEGYLAARGEVYLAEKRWPRSPFWARRQGTIEIAPTQMLDAAPRAGARRLPMMLPETDLATLVKAAAGGRRACDILTTARAQGVRATDRRLILALQYLVAEGALTHHRDTAVAQGA